MCVVAVFNIHRSFVLACKTSVVLQYKYIAVSLQNGTNGGRTDKRIFLHRL